MDFMRILRSLEEFLYEAVTWLLFYPRTLWRVAQHPIRTLRYSQTELADAPDEQYLDTVSPPLFLMLTLAIAHLMEIAARVETPVAQSTVLTRVFASEQDLLIVRSLLFAVYPLVLAADQLKLSGVELNRKTLRAPFFGQCYPASLFALVASAAGILMRAKQVELQLFGLFVAVSAIGWYVTVEILWFRISLEAGRRAVVGCLAAFLKATLIVAVVVGIAVVQIS
jgi:hypothetical protein